MDAEVYTNLYRTHRTPKDTKDEIDSNVEGCMYDRKSRITTSKTNIQLYKNKIIGGTCAFAKFASGGCPKLSDFVSNNDATSQLLGYICSRPDQSCGTLLGQLLECPSRVVLEEIESTGPLISWKDGHLSKATGFLPQDLSHLGNLEKIPGISSWSILGKRMPGLLSRSRFREAARSLPVFGADEINLPDHCLHEACTLLGILAYSFRYEQRITNDEDMNEPIPEGIIKPWTEVSVRLK